MGPVQNQHKKGQCEGRDTVAFPSPPMPDPKPFTFQWDVYRLLWEMAELVLGEGSWYDLWLQRPLSSFSSSSSFGAWLLPGVPQVLCPSCSHPRSQEYISWQLCVLQYPHSRKTLVQMLLNSLSKNCS